MKDIKLDLTDIVMEIKKNNINIRDNMEMKRLLFSLYLNGKIENIFYLIEISKLFKIEGIKVAGLHYLAKGNNTISLEELDRELELDETNTLDFPKGYYTLYKLACERKISRDQLLLKLITISRNEVVIELGSELLTKVGPGEKVFINYCKSVIRSIKDAM